MICSVGAVPAGKMVLELLYTDEWIFGIPDCKFEYPNVSTMFLGSPIINTVMIERILKSEMVQKMFFSKSTASTIHALLISLIFNWALTINYAPGDIWTHADNDTMTSDIYRIYWLYRNWSVTAGFTWFTPKFQSIALPDLVCLGFNLNVQ